ncbi:Fe(2+) transporter permease subunit FeoB [Catenovulum sp. 2E275]|uniref:Fe(2+) transporter permease subunit FeoB n=1 Tax=Catenovulum sp. 2E275 TaxID=2980497 RepID=UPI0021D272F6|nr:Fe(2+) transporter permease subunit FeoB [Catenovulum sp. 2E275]MCU4676892.1 Fe(2+) transporter permease subunit FeoB [Catenovulum sp. 2E275]
MQKKLSIAVIGNPNCGKTTLFNALTGAKQKVGNWSGVTVEKKTGQFNLNSEQSVELVDLPGTYSLDVEDKDISLDEKIARDYLSSGQSDLVLNIIDSSNLERSLYLTIQLRELGVPTLIVLNMADIAAKKGIIINEAELTKLTGAPVVSISASKKTGLDKLKQSIIDNASNQPPEFQLDISDSIEIAIEELQTEYNLSHTQAKSLLEGNYDKKSAVAWLSQSEAVFNELNEKLEQDLATYLASKRYQIAQDWVSQTVKHDSKGHVTFTDKVDNIVLNRWLGIPVFLGMMYLMFLFAISFGGAFIDFFDILFATIFVDGSAELFSAIGLPEWLVTLLSQGLGGGIQLVATFIPVIAGLYLFLSVIEDTGYMARAAFVMDRLMRALGLPGKSFVPLIVGFGCNVPSVMASRTLDTHKDRLLTISMSPFMSCGARLSVYALFAAAFFAHTGHNLVFLLYLLGIVMAVLTGLLLKRTLFKPTLTPFVMELPAYHVPSVKNVLIKTWDKLYGFITRAGKTIVIVVTLLSFLNSWGTDGSFGNEDSENSVLSQISKTITPVFNPIGISEDNWPATVGIFTGIFAKEAVVGTLDALYAQIGQPESDEGEATEFDLMAGISEAFATVPANLADVANNLLDPLGLGIIQDAGLEAAAEEQEVQLSTFQAMGDLFNGSTGAFAYLVFVLLYTPCVAVMGAMYREAGLKWMSFIALWSTGLAYITASCIYQVATFSDNPTFSASWLTGCLIISMAAIYAMRRHGRKIAEKEALIIPVVNIP